MLWNSTWHRLPTDIYVNFMKSLTVSRWRIWLIRVMLGKILIFTLYSASSNPESFKAPLLKYPLPLWKTKRLQKGQHLFPASHMSVTLHQVLECSGWPAGYWHTVFAPQLMGLFEPEGIARRGMSEKNVKYANQVQIHCLKYVMQIGLVF